MDAENADTTTSASREPQYCTGPSRNDEVRCLILQYSNAHNNEARK